MTASDMAKAYTTSARAWAGGPEQVYARLAQALVDAAPVPLHGARVLDLGAGTGVASRAALAAGAELVVALDNAAGMLERGRSMRPVVADACALPFASDAFDLVVAAMSLGHVSDPVQALRETRRVSGALLASVFQAEWTHPAKAAVDQALVPFGFHPPPWYVVLKRDTEPQVDDPASLGALATAAGYRDVSVRTMQVVVGLNTPAQLAAWRLGMAHLAPFVQSLPAPDRAAVQHAVESTLVGMPPLVIPLVVLAAT